MGDDTGVGQARQFLVALYERVAEISQKLEAADERSRRARARGATRTDPLAGDLRRELYEAHRLIEGLYRRFPETAPQSRLIPGAHTRHAASPARR